MTSRKLDCNASAISHNHSGDRVTVWHGAETPLYVCGYHASRDDVMRELYAAKAAASREA